MQFDNFSPAAENNKQPILDQLKIQFSAPATVLEIGSGSGQHAVFFAQALPHLQWQPADQAGYFQGLKKNISASELDNILPPVYLDLSDSNWPDNPAEHAARGLGKDTTVAGIDHVYMANVLHIVSKPLVEAFFKGLPAVIQGKLCLYGPFKYKGEFTSASNERFDGWLKSRDVDSGIRDIEWIVELAASCQLQLKVDVSMPANNQLLVFEKND